MAISRLNHAVLYVRSAARHVEFYRDMLGFKVNIQDPNGMFAFMRAPDSDNHHDIAFFSIGEQAANTDAGQNRVGMYHIAWQVASLAELEAMEEKLQAAGVLIGATDHHYNKSLYAYDPDGLMFEVMWLTPKELWGESENEAISRPLNVKTERAKLEPLVAALR